ITTIKTKSKDSGKNCMPKRIRIDYTVRFNIQKPFYWKFCQSETHFTTKQIPNYRPKKLTVGVKTDEAQQSQVQPELRDSTKRAHDQAHADKHSDQVRKASFTNEHTPKSDDTRTTQPHETSVRDIEPKSAFTSSKRRKVYKTKAQPHRQPHFRRHRCKSYHSKGYRAASRRKSISRKVGNLSIVLAIVTKGEGNRILDQL
ncbi:hypothetical protein KIN20_035969, partial [Parelaphostrongylus tenuis]